MRFTAVNSSGRFLGVPEVLAWRNSTYKDSRGYGTIKVEKQAECWQRLHRIQATKNLLVTDYCNFFLYSGFSLRMFVLP